MSALKYLRDVISGRIKHWTRTNNVIVNELWNKLKDLKNSNDTIFKHFMISAAIVIENLMGMVQNKQTIIRIDCKKLNTEKFRQLYTIMLSYFSFLFNITTRSLKEKEDIKKVLVEVTNKPEIVQRIFQQLDKCYSESTGEINMGALGGKIWDEIVEIIGFGEKMDPGKLVYFTMISGEAYKEAVKNIKAELNL